MFMGFTVVFVFCEFGHRLSKAFGEIEYIIEKLHWYKFPVQMWKLLPTLVMGAQKPAKLSVFGSVSCTREDFKKVCIAKKID